MRCPYYEEDKDESGIVYQINCENPEVYQVHEIEGDYKCPFPYEKYDCDIPIHNFNKRLI
jgi:hypothetical protein